MVNSFWTDHPCLICGRPPLRCRCDAKSFPETPLTSFEWTLLGLLIFATILIAVLAA